MARTERGGKGKRAAENLNAWSTVPGGWKPGRQAAAGSGTAAGTKADAKAKRGGGRDGHHISGNRGGGGKQNHDKGDGNKNTLRNSGDADFCFFSTPVSHSADGGQGNTSEGKTSRKRSGSKRPPTRKVDLWISLLNNLIR